MTSNIKNILLITLGFSFSPKAVAEVNLLTGAYLFNVNTETGLLSYDSRSNYVGPLGFGWKTQENISSKCQFEVKNFLLRSMTCKAKSATRNLAANIVSDKWIFQYTADKNLNHIYKNGRLIETIAYTSQDTVKKIISETCSYEFNFKTGSSNKFQATETISQCLDQHKQREITVFALTKGKNQAYLPALIKKIGGSLALKNDP